MNEFLTWLYGRSGRNKHIREMAQRALEILKTEQSMEHTELCEALGIGFDQYVGQLGQPEWGDFHVEAGSLPWNNLRCQVAHKQQYQSYYPGPDKKRQSASRQNGENNSQLC